VADNTADHLEQHDQLHHEYDVDHHAGYDYHDHPAGDDDDDLSGLRPEHTGGHNHVTTHDHHPAHYHDRNGSVIYYHDERTDDHSPTVDAATGGTDRPHHPTGTAPGDG
jgi:hypothetical protein